VVRGGIVRADDGVGLPAASNLVLAGGVFGTGAGAPFTRGLGPGPGQVQWAGSGGFGTMAYGYTVTLNGGAGLTWGEGYFVPHGSELVLGSPLTKSGAQMNNPIDLNGQIRTVRAGGVDPGMAGGILVIPGASSAFTRSLGDGPGQIRWTGSGGFGNHQGGGGLISVDLGGNAVPSMVTWGADFFVPDGAELLFATRAYRENDFRNPIDLAGGTRTIRVVSSGGRSTLSGALSNGALVKTGPGVLALNAVSTFDGDLIVAEGTLIPMVDRCLGSAAGRTIVAAGATVFLEKHVTITGEHLVLSGTGTGSGKYATGALYNSGNSHNTWGGPITLAQDVLIRAYGSASLTLDGPIDLADNILTLSHEGTWSMQTGILNGALRGPGCVIKEEAGTWILNGTVEEAVRIIVSEGVFRLGPGVVVPPNSLFVAGGVLSGLASTSNLVFDGGILGLSDLWTRTLGAGPGQVQWIGSGGFVGSRVTIGNASDRLVWGSGGFVPDGCELLFNTPTWTGVTTFVNPIDLNSQVRTVRVFDNPTKTSDRAGLAGVLSGTGGLNKAGEGTLCLKADNTYSGETLVTAGVLIVGRSTALGSTAGGTSVADGAALEIDDQTVTGEALILRGSGVGGTGGAARQGHVGRPRHPGDGRRPRRRRRDRRADDRRPHRRCRPLEDRQRHGEPLRGQLLRRRHDGPPRDPGTRRLQRHSRRVGRHRQRHAPSERLQRHHPQPLRHGGGSPWRRHAHAGRPRRHRDPPRRHQRRRRRDEDR